MEEKKFKATLEEAGVPPECHNAWWEQHKKDNGVFRLNCSYESLLLITKIVVKKGCTTSAPW